MDQFYIIMLFVGIILMVFLTVWTILDKKKVFKVVKEFDRKKGELVEIIGDAEQMIEELNKFSDYIVTQMDIKDEELRSNIKKADEQIRNIGIKAQNLDSGYQDNRYQDNGPKASEQKSRDNRDNKEFRDTRDNRDNRDSRDSRDSR
ncbi:MAG: hypothetical protein HGA22_00620, partial [Clostridiales bacterium]|nr:hypothetical protein [Clostridiales bacterium]